MRTWLTHIKRQQWDDDYFSVLSRLRILITRFFFSFFCCWLRRQDVCHSQSETRASVVSFKGTLQTSWEESGTRASFLSLGPVVCLLLPPRSQCCWCERGPLWSHLYHFHAKGVVLNADASCPITQFVCFFCRVFFSLLFFALDLCPLVRPSQSAHRRACVARGQAWRNNFTLANQMTFSSVPGGGVFYFGQRVEPLPLKDSCASKV